MIFVGDSINVSLIKESVEKTLGVSAIEGVDPSLCVAQGASLYLSDPITVPVEVNSFTSRLFFDEKLIKDLSSKFNGLTIENERTLNNILYSSKDYDISFKELYELIRENVLDGNESIESFYKKLENFINSRINEKNRKLNRFEDMNKKLKMENECLKEKIDLLVNENLDLNYKIKKLKDYK